MTKQKNTKRALLASVLSMMLCMAMLVGSTFAWFTDSVTSGKNKIAAGNLDVELEYATGFDDEGNPIAWESVEGKTDLFEQDTLWEPGHTEVIYLRVRNAGTLALKYRFSVVVKDESTFKNALGETGCKLSDYLVFGQVESADVISRYATREDVWDAVGSTVGVGTYDKFNNCLKEGQTEYVALAVYMPTTVGNEANWRPVNQYTEAPYIEFGLNLEATQTPLEEDSFDNTYDEKAFFDNNDGTYSDGTTMYVKANGENIAVTADETVKGLYRDAEGNAFVSEQNALKAIFADGTENITLIKDCSLRYSSNNSNGTPDTYILTDNAVIDLNGKTLTVQSNDRFMLAGDNITIKNGIIKAGTVLSGGKLQKIAYSLGVTAGSKNVVIENIDCEGGIEALGNDATVTLRNVTSTATTYYNMYLAGGATATIESGSFTHVDKVHFYTQTANDKVIVNGGIFSGGAPTHNGFGSMESKLLP